MVATPQEDVCLQMVCQKFARDEASCPIPNWALVTLLEMWAIFPHEIGIVKPGILSVHLAVSIKRSRPATHTIQTSTLKPPSIGDPPRATRRSCPTKCGRDHILARLTACIYFHRRNDTSSSTPFGNATREPPGDGTSPKQVDAPC